MAERKSTLTVLHAGSGLFDWGGIERYLVYCSRGLAERGNRVHLTAPRSSPLAQRSTVPVEFVSVRSQLDLRAVARYVRVLRGVRPEVVCAHYGRDFLVVPLAARLTGVPAVLVRHLALPWSPRKVRRYQSLYRGFVAVSQAVRDRLLASGVRPDRVQVALSGAPPSQPQRDRAEVRREYGMQGFAVGFVGRMVDDKGPQLLGPISRLVPEAIQVHAFGDGPLLGKLKSDAGAVRFHGRVNSADDVQNALDLVLVPSQWEEAFGYVALEAMSLGKPVIASRSGGLGELVVDGVTGFLCERTSPNDFADKVELLAENPGRCGEMGELALGRYRELFTESALAARVERALISLISVRPMG